MSSFRYCNFIALIIVSQCQSSVPSSHHIERAVHHLCGSVGYQQKDESFLFFHGNFTSRREVSCCWEYPVLFKSGQLRQKFPKSIIISPLNHPLMKPPTPNYRINLSDCQSSKAGRFLFSVAIACLLMVGTAAALARFVIPRLVFQETLVLAISSPSLQRQPSSPPPIASELLAVARPLPQHPAQRPARGLAAMPSAPILETVASLENVRLRNQSQEALLAIELFQEEEAERLEELRRKEEAQEKAATEAARLASLARQEAEEKKAAQIRQREAARQLAAQQKEAARKKAQEKAAAAQAHRVVSAPTIVRRTSPAYPVSARRSEAEGTTRISVVITAVGKVESPRVVTSSGNRSLDSSALAAVRKWRFSPAKNGLGNPVPFQMTIPVTFRLN
jgi:protein TonB